MQKDMLPGFVLPRMLIRVTLRYLLGRLNDKNVSLAIRAGSCQGNTA